MTNRSSQDELPTRIITNLQEMVEMCVFVADNRALKDHLKSNQIQQSELDRYLLRGLRLVQQKKRELSHVAQALTLLLQSGAKCNSDDLLDDQQTPYHIICQTSGDHHELLKLMIKSSHRTKIDARDKKSFTALQYAVCNANINCVKCLIAKGANVFTGNKRYLEVLAGKNKPWTSIMTVMWMINSVDSASPTIMFDILDILLEAAVEQHKGYFQCCIDYIQYALHAGNVNCIKKLIKIGTPLGINVYNDLYIWKSIAEKGNVELLKCMFTHSIDKDFIDRDGVSVLEDAVKSGHTEAVRYLLDIGVTIPTYLLKVLDTRCKQCKKKQLIIDGYNKYTDPDLCMRAIHDNKLDIVKFLDEYGSQTCKSFTALRCAVTCGNEDVVSYLLNKYTYPVNIEYILHGYLLRTYTLLAEPFTKCTSNITRMLLDHGADPAKPMCSASSTNGLMRAIGDGRLDIMAQYIRSGIDINVRSYYDFYEKRSPLEASYDSNNPNAAEMLFISGSFRGMINTPMFKERPNSRLFKLLKEWNVYDNNVIPLKQRCRCVILNHLCPRADLKIGKLPLPRCLIKFLNIPELDNLVYEYNKTQRR